MGLGPSKEKIRKILEKSMTNPNINEQKNLKIEYKYKQGDGMDIEEAASNQNSSEGSDYQENSDSFNFSTDENQTITGIIKHQLLCPGFYIFFDQFKFLNCMRASISYNTLAFSCHRIIASHFVFIFRNQIHNISDIAFQSFAHLHQNFHAHILTFGEFRDRSPTDPGLCLKVFLLPILIYEQFPKLFVTNFHSAFLSVQSLNI